MKRELLRALDQLDLLRQQLEAVEAERDAVQEAAAETTASEAPAAEAASRLLLRLRAIGPQTAAMLALEAFYRRFR